MGTFSNWLTLNITDPASVDAEVYQSLQALDAVVDLLANPDSVPFTYSEFFGSNVTTVGEALREIADYLDTSGAGRRLVTIPSYGNTFTDTTNVFSIVCNRAGVLGVAYLHLDTAPTGAAAVLQILKNASTMYELTFDIGEHGPKILDLSFITVAEGDVLTVKCITAGSAGGLSFTMEY
jgi:hypothetical protein